jgi:glycosyltransferase involved in cell wall biosynthesis
MICLTVARPLPRVRAKQNHTVSVIVPCRNEVGNVAAAVERIPDLGSHTEIIFCDDKSTDGTADEVRRLQQLYPDRDIKLYGGPGISKALNVRTGFDHARGDILMILDADLTTMPEELRYFYDVITSGKAEFVHGSRFVFPMEGEAMRPLNIAGNRFFSGIFPFLLGQRITDTLCGTKALWRLHWPAIRALAGSWVPRRKIEKSMPSRRSSFHRKPPRRQGRSGLALSPSVRPSPRAGQPEPGRS